MENKVLLILCDGMRPDALEQIQHPFYQQMKREGAYALDATTVMPSVTLPCHMSLFHSVDPSRHGVLTNTYVPQVRPIAGLCEQLRKFEKTCTMFYNWEELKDLTRPDSMMHTAYHSGHILGYEAACVESTRAAEAFIQKYQPDFTFLYLGLPDALGHGEGWMTQGYLDSLTYCWNCIEEICGTLPENYTVIVTADHGGHERTHGTELPEDMLIPVLMKGPDFRGGRVLANVNIKDIAPTVTNLLGVPANHDWEGTVIR